jgi:hypothetical protein
MAGRTQAARKAANQHPAAKTTHFRLVEETKGAVRMVEIDENGQKKLDDEDCPMIGRVYLRKVGLYDWLGADVPLPKNLNVTFSIPED